MSIGEAAGLIAAIAFAVLAGCMIYPFIRLGKMFDQIAKTVKESGEHALPAIDESVTTVKQVNKSLEDVNAITDAASSTFTNIGALTDLYGAFLGKPVIKAASMGYALKDTVQSFFKKASKGHDAGAGHESTARAFARHAATTDDHTEVKK